MRRGRKAERRIGARFIAALICLLSASQVACESAVTDFAVASQNSSTASDGNGAGFDQENSDQGVGNACFLGMPNLELRFSGASSLVISKTPFSALEAASGTLSLTEDELSTNAWTLGEDGSFEPGAVVSEGGCSGPVEFEVERVDVSPTGEIYLLFANSVVIAGERCRFVVVNGNDEASCADAETGFEFYQVEFTPDGDVYFSDRAGTIKTRSREDGGVTTIFSAASLDYALDGFKPLSDGTLLLQGDLTGTSRGFYRFVPASVSGGSDELQEQCLGDVDINVKGSAPKDELFIASDDSIYLKSTGSVCEGLEIAKTYRAEVGTGGLVFAAIPGITADRFAEDSAGNVYAVTGDDDDVIDAVTPVEAGAYEPVTTSLASTELFEMRGDAIYATGKNRDGKSSFIRKSLLSGEETDLIGESDLVVQAFDVGAGGDVAFAALDAATARRVFYRFNEAESSLEELASFPGEVLRIVYVDGTASHP